MKNCVSSLNSKLAGTFILKPIVALSGAKVINNVLYRILINKVSGTEWR